MSDRDPTERFTDRVELYVKHRPGYPPQVIELLQQECELTAERAVADLGSGTGISSRLFLDLGCKVYGVEPNAAMRAAAERYLSAYPTFVSVDGRAEATTLRDRSVDLVVAGQAFHWFDPARTHAELARILRPLGWVVLLWNARRLDATPFLRDYEALLVEFGTDYAEVRHENAWERLDAIYGPGRATRATFENAQEVDYAGLEGRLLSSSYVPAAGDPRQAPMLAKLRLLFDEHQRGGVVDLQYETTVFYGHLADAT
jgi:SAM-dependent methyltransferase